MVSPLCDNWRLEFPYTWPYECEDPFPPGHAYHGLSKQLAMAKYCGWDPMFLCVVTPRFTKASPKQYMRRYYAPGSDNVYEETRIETPYGELTLENIRAEKTARATKPWLSTREDYHRITWYLRNALDNIDMDAAIADGKAMMKAVGEKGILGTWVSTGYGHYQNQNELFYHLADWPDEYAEYMAAGDEYQEKLLDIYAECGFDYIFIGMDGTDWLSPWFVERYVMPSAQRLLAYWRRSGGKVLWHTCGHADVYLEKGYFNQLAPDILETLSEPPVGDVRSLEWARRVTDRSIVTKGNMPLDVLQSGSEEAVRKAVASIKDQTKGYRHLVGLSDAVLENTPLMNCLAFVDEARR